MITLYHTMHCPYCEKVRSVLGELGIEWTSKIAPRGTPERRELLSIGGKHQVPFLIDDSTNRQMYESEDIIQYLKKQYG